MDTGVQWFQVGMDGIVSGEWDGVGWVVSPGVGYILIMYYRYQHKLSQKTSANMNFPIKKLSTYNPPELKHKSHLYTRNLFCIIIYYFKLAKGHFISSPEFIT